MTQVRKTNHQNGLRTSTKFQPVLPMQNSRINIHAIFTDFHHYSAKENLLLINVENQHLELQSLDWL